MRRPRITGGSLKGRPLPTAVPEGARPTSARVREAVFSMLGQDLSGQRVLDAFGGSGLLGLEAWSRGAEVVVVESNRRTARAIQQNAKALGAEIDVRVGRIQNLVSDLGEFDGALVDPPYADDVEPILRAVAAAVSSWLVLESDQATHVPQSAGLLARDRSRNYGGTSIHLYRRTP